MNTEQILMCVVALILGVLLANMLKSVCGCKVVEGNNHRDPECETHDCPPGFIEPVRYRMGVCVCTPLESTVAEWRSSNKL